MSETGIPSAAVHPSAFKGGEVEKGEGMSAAVSGGQPLYCNGERKQEFGERQ